MDRFETDQKALTAAPAGTAAPPGPATALASPGTSRTELMRVFYAVLYPYLLGAVLSAVSVLSKIDRPRRPRPQSAHRATAAPMLRAYVDRGLGAVPARYR